MSQPQHCTEGQPAAASTSVGCASLCLPSSGTSSALAIRSALNSASGSRASMAARATAAAADLGAASAGSLYRLKRRKCRTAQCTFGLRSAPGVTSANVYTGKKGVHCLCSALTGCRVWTPCASQAGDFCQRPGGKLAAGSQPAPTLERCGSLCNGPSHVRVCPARCLVPLVPAWVKPPHWSDGQWQPRHSETCEHKHNSAAVSA